MSTAAQGVLVVAAVVFWLNAMCAFLVFIGHRRLVLGVVASALYTVVGLGIAIFVLGLPLSPPFLLFAMLAFGWFLYAYRRYVQVRQDELLHVITTAAEAHLPLAPAVAAYVRDRPREGKRQWDALLA